MRWPWRRAIFLRSCTSRRIDERFFHWSDFAQPRYLTKQHFYCLLDVILCSTNSCRTSMTAVVPRAMPAFSKVNAAP